MAKKRAPSSPADAAFEEAETLQQRGERRKGQEAVVCFEQAVLKFKEAIQLGLPGNKASEARFGIAESSASQAEAVLQAAAHLSDADASMEAENASLLQAASLYEQSVQMYKHVLSDQQHGGTCTSAGGSAAGGTMRADAAVNCGNALSSWAEITFDFPQLFPGAPTSTEALLAESKAAYESALQEEDDAATHSNLGDTLVQYAQLLWSLGRGQEAEAAAQGALQEYQTACSMSSSEDGDDLPGLLTNWGQGLLAIAPKVQDQAARQRMLEEACHRLQQAADFERADPEPLNALGDVLTAQAEEIMNMSKLLQPAAATPASLDDRRAAAQAAISMLQSALEKGYSMALRINRNNMEALVGSAEVHAAAGKVAYAVGESASALEHWSSSVSHFEAALTRPDLIGRFSERCVVRYNAALVLAAVGREADAEALLSGLLATGSTCAAELLSEADLFRFHNAEWFQRLTASAASRRV